MDSVLVETGGQIEFEFAFGLLGVDEYLVVPSYLDAV